MNKKLVFLSLLSLIASFSVVSQAMAGNMGSCLKTSKRSDKPGNDVNRAVPTEVKNHASTEPLSALDAEKQLLLQGVKKMVVFSQLEEDSAMLTRDVTLIISDYLFHVSPYTQKTDLGQEFTLVLSSNFQGNDRDPGWQIPNGDIWYPVRVGVGNILTFAQAMKECSLLGLEIPTLKDFEYLESTFERLPPFLSDQKVGFWIKAEDSGFTLYYGWEQLGGPQSEWLPAKSTAYPSLSTEDASPFCCILRKNKNVNKNNTLEVI
jgi:hypothetical protein